MIVASLLVGLLATVLLLPTVSDLVSLLRLALGGRGRRRDPRAPAMPPRLRFIVAAHNE